MTFVTVKGFFQIIARSDRQVWTSDFAIEKVKGRLCPYSLGCAVHVQKTRPLILFATFKKFVTPFLLYARNPVSILQGFGLISSKFEVTVNCS